MSKKTDIVLSVSAVAAALSALEQVATESLDRVIAIQACDSDFQDEIDAALSGVQVECELQKRMGVVLPKMKVEPENLEAAWERLARHQEEILVASSDPNSAGLAFGLRNGWMDSTLQEGTRGIPQISQCYVNCHSACHGSRGWR